MTLELTEYTEVHTLWFVGWDWGDFLGYVFRQPGGVWTAEWRIRYHTAPKKGDPFQEDDEKRYHTITPSNPDEPADKLVEALVFVADLVRYDMKADVYDRVDIQGTGMDALKALEDKEWCFSKLIPVGGMDPKSGQHLN